MAEQQLNLLQFPAAGAAELGAGAAEVVRERSGAVAAGDVADGGAGEGFRDGVVPVDPRRSRPPRANLFPSVVGRDGTQATETEFDR
jgi:hypothetical protein